VSAGRLSQLRVFLTNELQARLGKMPAVRIFQDIKTIPYGTDWDHEIGRALSQSAFFIPIVTPAFVQSKMCCLELIRFQEYEAARGRKDLLFPLHYIDTDDLSPDRGADCFDPSALRLIRARQMFDFRDLRFRDPNHEHVLSRVAELAGAIRAALRRDSPGEAIPLTLTGGAAARVAEDKRQADEMARLAEEKRQADETARLAEEKRQADEMARLVEEKRQANKTARLAEEQRKADEEARLAEEQRKAEEEARLAEEKRKADEETRLAEEQRKADEDTRLAEEQRKADETARLAEEQRKAEEEARLAEEQRKAEEEARLAEEKRKAEETARRAEEQRKADEAARLA